MSRHISATSEGIILVPLDVASSNSNTLAYAAELCENGGHQMVVMHAVHEPADHPGLYQKLEPSNQLLPAELRAERICRRLLIEAQQRFPDSAALASAKLRIVVGLPAQRITEVADQVGASLIVMTSTKRRGLSNLLHGSIADSVAGRISIPVLRLHRMDTRSLACKPHQATVTALSPEGTKGTSSREPGISHLPQAV